MTLSLSLLLLIGIGYLLLLFATAYLTERGLLPATLVRHPLTHVLSLAVYASAWTFYGAFGIAAESGFTFLASYLGATVTFILAPLILLPLLRIARTHQLSSLADLFAFRYRSAMTGSFITLLIVIISMPLIAIQIQAFSNSLSHFDERVSSQHVALIFCLIISVFSMLFGARQASIRSRHDGLMVAIALESIVKILALLSMAGFVLFALFGGTAELANWLSDNPDQLNRLQSIPADSNWQILLVAFFAAAFITPHMFHLLFSENASERSLVLASWVMPLLLLIMAICIPVLLWGTMKLKADTDPDFLLIQLGFALEKDWFIVTAFVGGLSASSGVIIVANVALASMLQNHLLLPVIKLPDTERFYSWLLWMRRSLILLVMAGSYLVYLLVGNRFPLAQLGLITFIGFLQFLPGILATLYWQKASRFGFLLGLCAGMLIWFIVILAPVLNSQLHEITPGLLDQWYWWAIISLIINALLLITGSWLIKPSPEEEETAVACVLNALPRPKSSLGPDNDSIEDLQLRLASRLGTTSAHREIEVALKLLNLPMTNKLRPLDLLRLRNILENNLSGLLGPAEATTLLRPQTLSAGNAFRGREIHLLEEQLESYSERLSGLAAELDKIRRYHRSTLQHLPIGVCTLNEHQHILFWNQAMVEYTGIIPEAVLGLKPAELPPPWSELLHHFCQQNTTYQPALRLELNNQQYWFSLHKTDIEDGQQGRIILIEDETEHKLLANRLAHSERLTSIGRFAAGVAHEIGNPVTGIACLAQNLKLETEQPEVLDTGEAILEQTQRISRIVQSLIRFAHTGQTDHIDQLTAVSLNACIEEAIDLMRFDETRRSVKILTNLEPALYCTGDYQLLLQVLVNLLNNACDASPDHSTIMLTAKTEESWVALSIVDEGSGISPDLQERIFEPFFTTKEPGKGTGLGLALVYNIITEHCGNIEFISPADKKQKKGTQVIIQLPAWTEPNFPPGQGLE
ncbi:histidine kinase [Nitrincola sp. A-D6]|uniref:ATP-binding protein n=1 Tax=Nitrincola sp. A-D6 TaxID=1545442 RepID=UPI00051FD06F|nr:ATP-binding protein [Nitrincola sp. A-D6]KGK42330.1 histidine kinase [Nitrincola sp. A-D6]